MSLLSTLVATVSPDGERMQEALQILQAAAEENLPALLASLTDIIADVSVDSNVRSTAAVFLKNSIGSINKQARKCNANRWLCISNEIRSTIKEKILSSLGTEGRYPSMLAQCISTIAVVELPQGQWTEIIPLLIKRFDLGETNEECRRAILDAIGYICEDMNHTFLIPYSNMILTLIVEGANNKHGINIQICSMKALFNSLEAAVNNFEKQEERNFLMELVCNGTQSENYDVSLIALKSLCRIVTLYYPVLEVYMNSLFQITVKAMNSSHETIVMQGIEFWCCVCDEEYEILCQSTECTGLMPSNPNRMCKNYILGALGPIMPIILSKIVLTFEDEDADPISTPAISARVCLKLFSSVSGNPIIETVMPFINVGLASSEWQMKEAACIVIGSVLEGPEPNFVMDAFVEPLRALIVLMMDPCMSVRDSAFWALGRFYEQIPFLVTNQEILTLVISSALENFESPARVAQNVFWMLTCIFMAVYEVYLLGKDEKPNEHVLSPFYLILMERLLQCVLNTAKQSKSNLKTFQFEALIELIRVYPGAHYQVVTSSCQTVFNSMHTTLTSADREDKYTLLSLFCSCLQVLFQTLCIVEVLQMFQVVVNYLLTLLSASENADNAEDIFLTISSIFSVLPKEAVKTMLEPTKPFLLIGLKTQDQPGIFVAAAGVLEEIASRLESEFTPFADEFMSLLFRAFECQLLTEKVRAQVLSSFGDIALAIGPEFSVYLEMVLAALYSGIKQLLSVEGSDMDDVESLFEFQVLVLSAYSAVLQSVAHKDDTNYSQYNGSNIAMNHDNCCTILSQYSNTILDAVNLVILQPIPCSSEVLEKAFCLVGDLVDIMKRPIAIMVMDTGLYSNMLGQAYRFNSQSITNSITWVQSLIKLYKS